MGLKNLSAWNNALLCKTLWKIHLKKDSLWIKWVNHKYSSSGSVWEWNWHREESPLIKQILQIRDELLLKFGSVDAAVSGLNVWFDGKGGVTQAYTFFVQSLGRWPWKPLLTRSLMIPKHRFIFWLFAHSKLLTLDHLGHVSDKSCVLCKVETESISHLFYLCTKTRPVWDEIREWLGMRKRMGSSTAILRAFRGVYRGRSLLNKMRLLACAATVYYVWNARNKAIFENETHSADDIVKKVKILCFRCIPQAIDGLHRV